MPSITVNSNSLTYPIKVCRSSKFTHKIGRGNKSWTSYACRRKARTWPIKLKAKKQTACRYCQCESSCHLRLTYEVITVFKNREPVYWVEQSVLSEEIAIEKLKEHLRRTEMEIKEKYKKNRHLILMQA